ncbi:RNA polymerase sigma factor [Hyalangium rubrum]|uniref:Sigma factor n=1 Tax=Hyalangium rubrum TaxID=3103134 RepID=A0ABU5H5Q2_9BACT|nr:sigma factor [Hyalangium sp. s54d21]MDY7228087.1 sigma factor [Hyalangium sp. s54d21]
MNTQGMTMSTDRERVEQEVRELCQSGDIGRAVERTLQGYGMEIMRLMASVLHNPELAKDAFSVFCESLLKGLPAFRWESSLRTWSYRLARNACYQLAHAPAARETPVSSSGIPDEALKHRSDTRPWQRTSVKERFRALRESLEPEERMLLLLRVDQRLAWTEVARVMWDEDTAPTSAALSRKATALRQQFQRIKAHLRTLALQQGLIDQDESMEPAQ